MFAAIGEFCFRRRFLIIAAWLALCVGGFFAAGPVFDSMDQDQEMKVESEEGWRQLEKADPDAGNVVALISKHRLTDADRSAVTSAVADMESIAGIATVQHPFAKNGDRLRTDDSALVIAEFDTSLHEDAPGADEDKISDIKDQAIVDFTKRADQLGDELSATVAIGGGDVLNSEANDQVGTDLSRAETISLPLSLLVMIVVFGGFLAALVPVLGAVVAIFGAFVSLWGFTTFTTMDSSTVTIVTLLGLGLSIDYGLLMITRYREELRVLGAAKRPEPALRQLAIANAARTSGRTVAFSALTVAAALGGLMAMSVPFMRAVGAAGISIALMTMLVALTLVPAFVRLFGRWIKPAKEKTNSGGVFGRLAARVQRRPVVTLVSAFAVLAILSAPAAAAKFTDPGIDELPNSLESVRVYRAMESDFGMVEDPAITVIARTTPEQLDLWAARFGTNPRVENIGKAEAAKGGLSVLDVDLNGDIRDSKAQDLVKTMRADRPASQSWVSGETADFYDEIQILKNDLPWAIAIMVIVMAILLFMMTGSVTIPLKALVANLLSLGASLGALTALFQWGWLSGPLDLLTVQGLDPFNVVLIFTFAFGLSMDYEVFLLGRIKELHDQGYDNDSAVRIGLQRTGKIITSAALLMILVFAAFGAAKVGGIEQIGVGLVVAILVDATIVRCLLVPATMTLLGKWNWWAPAPLRRLHAKFGLTEAPSTPPTPVAERELVGARR